MYVTRITEWEGVIHSFASHHPALSHFSFSLDRWRVFKMLPPLSLLALCLVSVTSPVAGTPGAFVDAGNTLISAMMASNP